MAVRRKSADKPTYVLSLEEAGKGLAVCELEVSPLDVVYVKSVVEASEGLANVFAESGGRITLASPPDRAHALFELATDVVRDCEGARLIARDRGE
jgi:hypothetical protein